MRFGVGSGAVLLVLTLVAPASPAVSSRSVLDPSPRTGPGPYVRSVLTPDGTHYRFRRADGRVVVSAPRANRDWNRREVFHRPGARPVRDQTTCATWVRQSSGMVQEGLAVRIVDRGGRVRAVTLTKNTLFRIHWVFNLLTWDTARRGDPWRRIRQFDMSEAVGATLHRLEPLPWRVCLRATGRTVAFKVWLPGRMREPSWSDPTYVRRARVPQGFVVAGRPGWYVGHVPAGGSVVYSGLSAR